MPLRRFIFLLLLGISGALLFRTYAFEGIYLASNSMAPTLPQGTHVIVNKFTYMFQSPRRGDIVMFETPQVLGKGLVKRVIAVEGDKVFIKNKAVYLNGRLLDEPYVQHTMPDTLLVGDNMPEIVIPKGYVLVMGDNRDVSGDSRDWKTAAGEWWPYVSVSSILGRVLLPS